MNYEKALALYRNDKTLQILRAEHFPLLVSFFHFAFKELNKDRYVQPVLTSLLTDFIFSLERHGVNDYQQAPLEYLQKWTHQGYLRRFYDSGDEPFYQLSPAASNALRWLEDLNKQQFTGTYSRLVQFFTLLQNIVNKTAGPYERIQQLQQEKMKIEKEIEAIKKGNYEKPSDTLIKEEYFLAEETARRLLADFRQVEENFRELDTETRQKIIRSNLAKGKLLDDIFKEQDYLWDTDQGRSFKAFWEFLMSETMQEELEQLLEKLNKIPAINEIKQSQLVDRIKSNLVDAGDKVNRSNDGLIEQLRKYVEQKNLLESKYILASIEKIELLLLEIKEKTDLPENLMEIDGLFKPILFMEKPLFSPPVKVEFNQQEVEQGTADSDTDVLFEQFYIDVDELKNNIKDLLRYKQQVSLSDIVAAYEVKKGMAELLGYIQIATSDEKHYIHPDRKELLSISNSYSDNSYDVQAPLIIFKK
ncbi:MAG: DUF3375 domain-containing protein [Sediminibacterium sp.]